jgi:hypothetical protein
MRDTPAPKSALPEWPNELFQPFLDRQELLSRVLHLSMSGITMLRAPVIAIEALGVNGPVEARRLEHAKAEWALAQKEIDSGFPLLHEQVTVSLWGSLESLVHDLVARWLGNNPIAWQADAVKRLRVRVGEYEALAPQDRCSWITDLLDQEVGGPLRSGVTRFECLLQPFDLDGQVPDTCRQSIFELSQVRNVIVHRRSVADRRLIEACPWLSLTVGDPVRVSHEQWSGYNSAAGIYVLELIQRVRVLYGVGRYKPKGTESGV